MDDQCELCDEGNEDGDEIAEFWSVDQCRSIVAHAQCGFDAGLRLA